VENAEGKYFRASVAIIAEKKMPQRHRKEMRGHNFSANPMNLKRGTKCKSISLLLEH